MAIIKIADTDSSFVELVQASDLDVKADKYIPTTADNVALLDATGNLLDSGAQYGYLAAIDESIAKTAVDVFYWDTTMDD